MFFSVSVPINYKNILYKKITVTVKGLKKKEKRGADMNFDPSKVLF